MSLNKIKKITAKKKTEKIVMITCYDYSFACILDELDIDIILVGDSLANVILGIRHTKDLTFKEMYNHTRAVCRGITKSLRVADMPYRAYQRNPQKAYDYARKLIEECNADAVKLEWFDRCSEVTKRLVRKKIPVMGHIGLTPQTVDKLGGFKVQGKDLETARRLKKQAHIFEDEGAFSIVLECIPRQVAHGITDSLTLPTIGIGSGQYCDGQVLVLYDLLGLYPGKKNKFVKVYGQLNLRIQEAVTEYVREVRRNVFPDEKHSFSLDPEVLGKIQKYL